MHDSCQGVRNGSSEEFSDCKSATHPRSRVHCDHGRHMRRNITFHGVGLNSLLNPRIGDSRDCCSELAVFIVFQGDAAGPVLGSQVLVRGMPPPLPRGISPLESWLFRFYGWNIADKS